MDATGTSGARKRCLPRQRLKRIGRKRDLAPAISAITRIPLQYPQGEQGIRKASIAQRMSWVSRRKTTKAEDRVYCLMGLFGIHMLLLYGKREPAAFKRLHLEILKDSDDTSMFAWACDIDHEPKKTSRNTPKDRPQKSSLGTWTGSPEPPGITYRTHGLLARSPGCFDNLSDVRRADLPKAAGYCSGIRTPLVVDNKGPYLCLPLRHQDLDTALVLGSDVQMVLGCESTPETYSTLDLRDVSANGGRYVRVNASKLGKVSADSIKDEYVYRRITTETRVFNRMGMASLSEHIQSARATVIADAGDDELLRLKRDSINTIRPHSWRKTDKPMI